MRRISVILLVLLSMGFWCTQCQTAGLDRPITDADTVLAIYTNDWGLHSRGGPGLILAVWDDGQIVWSDDPLHGGAPFRTAKIDPKKIKDLLARLESDGYFNTPGLDRSYFGPDSMFTTILAKSGKKKIMMQSWHELSEASGKLVASNGSLMGLDNKPRLGVLSKNNREYLLYRLAWAELRGQLRDLIPSESTKATGKAQMKAGKLSWVPSP